MTDPDGRQPQLFGNVRAHARRGGGMNIPNSTFGDHAGSNQIPDRQLDGDWVATDSLRRLSNHVRKLGIAHVREIAKNIEHLGWLDPILIDEDNAIIAGYGRWEAAKHLGLEEVPVIRASGLTDAEKRTYRIAENKLSERGEWDTSALKEEFVVLLDHDIDIDLTGFDMAEVDLLLEIEDEGDGAFPPQLPGVPAISRHGDVWQVGPHRLMCGDATNSDDLAILLNGEAAKMVFTDPPYNVRVGGNVAGIRKPKHREFKMASGEMTEAEYREFLSKALERLAAVSQAGAILYVCIDWRHMAEMQAAGLVAGLEYKQLCVWVKTNFGMGSFYRSQHELIFVFKKPGPHTNNFGLGGKGRNRTNVWSYAGANGFRKGRSEDLENHPTVKPVKMVADAIADCSRRGDVILDPFVGSGTTLVAAAQKGRRGYGMDLDPRYVDCAADRLSKELDLPAILVATGQTLADVSVSREYGGA